uniref:Ac45-VOA1_TM domain-containing protein n=1 Tax=Parastrongyloides trichosuri TaxID=131310 RepID=A0A0N4ZCC2_PARTI
MKLLATLTLLVASTFAKDAIIWSKNDLSQITLSSAAKSGDVTIFTLPGFNLAEFSSQTGAYSTENTGIASSIKLSNSKTESFSSPIEVDNSDKVIATSSWTDLNEKYADFVKANEGKSYTAALVNSGDIQENSVRSKRDAATNAISGTASGKVPVIAPTDYSKNASCLFYLEGLSLIHYDPASKATYKASFIDFSVSNNSDSYKVDYSCGGTTADSTFTVTITTKGKQNDDKEELSIPAQDIQFFIKVSLVDFYTWEVSEFTIKSAKVTVNGADHSVSNGTNAAQNGIKFFDAIMYSDYGYACSQTPAVFAPADGNNQVGMTLNGFQIQMIPAVANADGSIKYGFVHNMNDCVPTFSIGSWMSIISALILAGVLLFGFLMLNSVQTMDRFDDPKAKQIVINFKE